MKFGSEGGKPDVTLWRRDKGQPPSAAEVEAKLRIQLGILRQIAEDGKLGERDIPPEDRSYYVGVSFFTLQATLEMARDRKLVLPGDLLQGVTRIEEQYGSQAREWRDSLRRPR